MTNLINLDLAKQNVISDIQLDFNLSDYAMHFMVFGQTFEDEYTDQLRKEVPEDLMKYRYLLHPTRLLIMKLLFTEHMISSVQIKEVMGASWSDITPHIQSLIQKGYVEPKEHFTHTGTIRQFLYITALGVDEFKELFYLLTEFTKNSIALGLIQDNDEDETNLYPK